MGWAIMNSGGRPSAVGSEPRTSYTMSASVVTSLCVFIGVLTSPRLKTDRTLRHCGGRLRTGPDAASPRIGDGVILLLSGHEHGFRRAADRARFARKHLLECDR